VADSGLGRRKRIGTDRISNQLSALSCQFSISTNNLALFSLEPINVGFS
jgi:hypothetical protein